MSDDALEAARIKYTKGLQNVIDTMRECAEYAELYMAALNDPDSAPNLVNGTLKRKRGKGDVEEDGGKRKRVKDPNAPKRPASSYILFQNDVRSTIKAKYPDLSPSELRTAISQEWATLKEDQKEHYKKAAETGKTKYLAEKAAYIARSPEEVAAAAEKVQDKPKRNKPAQKKTKTPEKVVSPESSPEPEAVPIKQQTSSAAETEESSDESSDEEGAEEEVDDEDEDEDEEEEPRPSKKAKVSEKFASKQTARKSKA
ncbi:hypothetical protein V5O48_000785 [Marasmius crinis-equi]|uniref:HMG box domain-containing protein n=1 Tax=Marasmius crinis-equi TaxID=585013 RepID=A0ABR3G036_9AGAR